MSFNPQDYPVCRGVQLASFALLDGIKERVVEENIQASVCQGDFCDLQLFICLIFFPDLYFT